MKVAVVPNITNSELVINDVRGNEYFQLKGDNKVLRKIHTDRYDKQHGYPMIIDEEKGSYVPYNDWWEVATILEPSHFENGTLYFKPVKE